MHVSDRLLSTLDGDPYDRRSNKTLVVWTSDALAVLGYSGDAFHGSVPMDDWLAGALCSDPTSAWMPAGIPNDLGELRIDQVFNRLQGWMDWRLRAKRTAARRSSYLRLHLAGFRRRGNRVASHFAGYLHYGPRSAETERELLRAPGGIRGRGLALATPPIGVHALANLQGAVQAAANPGEMGVALLAMMKAASTRPGVGNDLLLVEVDPTRQPKVQVAHVLGSQGQDRVVLGNRAVAVTYTPWFVSPWGVIPPMIANTGEMGVEGSPVRIRIQVDDGASLLDGSQISIVAKRQVRQPDPGDRPRLIHGETRRTDIHLEAGPHTAEIRYPSPKRPPRE